MLPGENTGQWGSRKGHFQIKMELQMKSQTQHKTTGRHWSTPESFPSKGRRLLCFYTCQSLTINQEEDGGGMSMKGVYSFLHCQFIQLAGQFQCPLLIFWRHLQRRHFSSQKSRSWEVGHSANEGMCGFLGGTSRKSTAATSLPNFFRGQTDERNHLCCTSWSW